MNTRNIITVAKKEIRTFLDNPTTYVVLIAFTLLWQFLFFKQVFLIGRASLSSLYAILPWLMLVFVPAITMGAFAKEKDEYTLELLLTHPLREIELILGKFLGALFYASIPLLFTIPVAASLNNAGALDWGVFWGQFFASILLAASLISLGIFISSLFQSQIASLLVTSVVGFIFSIIGSDFILLSLPLSFVQIFENLSLISHISSMARGVLDLRDVWYFISFMTTFYALTYLQLLKRKYGNNRSKYLKFQTGVYLFIGSALLLNIVGTYIPGRIDLTSNKAYSLSPATIDTVKGLDDILTITVYSSDKLPSQYQPILREVKDVLRDYKNVSNGNLVVKYKDPSASAEIAQEALNEGIQQMQFNVIGQEEYQLKTGFMGIAMTYAGKKAVIPFVQTTSDLEYQLTSNITNITSKTKKIVAFLSGFGEKSLDTDYKIFKSELSKQFEVKTLSLDKENPQIDDNVDVLVIPGSSVDFEDNVRKAIKSHLDKGKSLFYMADPYFVSFSETLTGAPNPFANSTLLDDYGIYIKQEIAYDLKLNEGIRFSNGVNSYALPYPFWVRSLPGSKTSQITSKIQNVSIPWPATIDVDVEKVQAAGIRTENLLVTSPYGGIRSGESLNLDPNQQLETAGLGVRTLALSITGFKDNNVTGPFITIVGSSEFLSDSFIQNAPQNLAFGMNTISWLSQEDTLADIKIKGESEGMLYFNNPIHPSLIKYFNMFIAVAIPAAFAVLRFIMKKNMRYRKYAN